MENKMTVQDLILNLKAAGFEADMIERYLSCWNAGEIKGQLKLLSAKRASLLAHVHKEEKRIECLDYLVYQLGKGEQSLEKEPVMEENVFYVTVGGNVFTAVFADNSGAGGLRELLANGPLNIQMRDYGGFEKVGALGQSLTASDVQTTTQAGDIVLYQGDQIVMFYGSNSWSYTRLGTISDLTGWEDALGSDDVQASFSLTIPRS